MGRIRRDRCRAQYRRVSPGATVVELCRSMSASENGSAEPRLRHRRFQRKDRKGLPWDAQELLGTHVRNHIGPFQTVSQETHHRSWRFPKVRPTKRCRCGPGHRDSLSLTSTSLQLGRSRMHQVQRQGDAGRIALFGKVNVVCRQDAHLGRLQQDHQGVDLEVSEWSRGSSSPWVCVCV